MSTSNGYGPIETSLAASGGPTTVKHQKMTRAYSHHIHAEDAGTAQVDLHVADSAVAAQTVTVSAGSPQIVNLPNVTHVVVTETSTTNPVKVYISGRE